MRLDVTKISKVSFDKMILNRKIAKRTRYIAKASMLIDKYHFSVSFRCGKSWQMIADGESSHYALHRRSLFISLIDISLYHFRRPRHHAEQLVAILDPGGRLQIAGEHSIREGPDLYAGRHRTHALPMPVLRQGLPEALLSQKTWTGERPVPLAPINGHFFNSVDRIGLRTRNLVA
jgi:hypothetical protein